MRLFLSYARVDKPYCVQIVDTLDAHEIWYDQRIYAGQDWWKEILRRLNWCEGFVYLLSPDSVNSEYCQREYELARNFGRCIFPILIRSNTVMPESMADLNYLDVSQGIGADTVKRLLNSIYTVEKHQKRQSIPSIEPTNHLVQSPLNLANIVSAAATAMENGQYDQVVYLLKQAKENGYQSRYINVNSLLQEAEAALARQTYLVEAEREYQQILALVRHPSTRKIGLDAFQAFRKDFPDYDPENLATYGIQLPKLLLPKLGHDRSLTLNTVNLPLLTWCEIPAGKVEIEYWDGEGQKIAQQVDVSAFRMSKYPVTNQQWDVFVRLPSGYANTAWWQFSPEAHQWRLDHPETPPARFKGDERPREMISWYNALAFCNWLSAEWAVRITLPTFAQWQRAAQGDDGLLLPWGNQYEPERSNSAESAIKMTTIVTRYPEGASPYGVFDMAGNVWEWCIDGSPSLLSSLDVVQRYKRFVRGGSYMSSYRRAQTDFAFELDPESYHSAIGFRIVQNF